MGCDWQTTRAIRGTAACYKLERRKGNMRVQKVDVQHFDKFKLTYLTENEKSLVLDCGLMALIMVGHLFRSTVSKSNVLDDAELKDLVLDIQTAKDLGYWVVEDELQAIEMCKHSQECAELYKRLSDADKREYRRIQLEQIGLTLD